MSRVYVPSVEKHKWPKGYGSLCPKMPLDVPAGLLEQAIEVPAVGANKLWAASGRWCFCAHPSPGAGPEAWHGFPVTGAEVDERVLDALQAGGLINPRERRNLRRQRQLPEAWP